MDKDFIAHSYEYGVWANRRLLEQAARLTDEQLRHKFSQGALPILDTFAHLVSAEWRWFQSWQRLPMMDRITVGDVPTVDAVRAKWEPLFAERRAFIDSLTPERLDVIIRREIAGREYPMPLWVALIHVANHGTQHRSEIAAMLTDAGQSPGDLDMTLYFFEQKK